MRIGDWKYLLANSFFPDVWMPAQWISPDDPSLVLDNATATGPWYHKDPSRCVCGFLK